MDSQESYIYGLLLADGNIYFTDRNRGRVSLELNVKDKDIVLKLFQLIPNSHIRERTRDTNFKKGYASCSFVNSQLEFRTWLFNCGFPKEDKTFNAAPPKVDYVEKDFWRGFIDGDGSIGITSKNIPFISLVTDSENIKDAYLDYLYRNYGLKKKSSRNKRDNAFNIMVTNENAVKIVKDLYLGSSLYLDRKYQKALELQSWVRTVPKRNTRPQA